MLALDLARTNPAAYAARLALLSRVEQVAHVQALSHADLALHLTALLDATRQRSGNGNLVVELHFANQAPGSVELRIGMTNGGSWHPSRTLLRLEHAAEALVAAAFEWAARTTARLALEPVSFIVSFHGARFPTDSFEERLARARALFPYAAVTVLHVSVQEPYYDRGAERIEGWVSASAELRSSRNEAIYASLGNFGEDRKRSVVDAVNAKALELRVPAGNRRSLFVERGGEAIVTGLAAARALIASGDRLYWISDDPDAPPKQRRFDQTPRGLISSVRWDGSDLRVLARGVHASFLALLRTGDLVSVSGNTVSKIEVRNASEARAAAPLAELPAPARLAPVPNGDELFLVCEEGFSSVIVRLHGPSGAVTTVIEREDKRVTGLLVAGERLVWCEREMEALFVARLDGSDVRRIEGVRAHAIALLEPDVMVLEGDSLTRVPLDGRPPQVLASVVREGKPGHMIATPAAVFVAMRPFAAGDTAHGASLLRVRLPAGPAEPIHAIPPGPGTDAVALLLATSTIEGMAARDGSVYFLELGTGYTSSGAVRRVSIDAPALMPLARLLRVEGAPDRPAPAAAAPAAAAPAAAATPTAAPTPAAPTAAGESVLGYALAPGESVLYFREHSYLRFRIALAILGLLSVLMIIGIFLLVGAIRGKHDWPKAHAITTRRLLSFPREGSPDVYLLDSIASVAAERPVLRRIPGSFPVKVGTTIGSAIAAAQQAKRDQRSKLDREHWKGATGVRLTLKNGDVEQLVCPDVQELGPALARVIQERAP